MQIISERQAMTQFHEGQEVEVLRIPPSAHTWIWRKAKIEGMHGDKYLVRFADGAYADFGADHIRTAVAIKADYVDFGDWHD